MTSPTPEREAEIRAWAAGSFADGNPHIPEGAASFTRDLLAMLDRERERAAFTHSVLALIDGFSDYGGLRDEIWWRTDDEYAPVTFFVNCNDLFFWATADCESLTPENLPELTQAVADVRIALGVPPGRYERIHGNGTPEGLAADESRWSKWYDAGGFGSDLFCARARKRRPQRPCYERWPAELHPLFDAGGPERERGDEG